jgi:hypothetical protein
MTSPNGPRPARRVLAQISAFLLILLPGLGQHLTRLGGPAWLTWAWLGLTTLGMILALLIP